MSLSTFRINQPPATGYPTWDRSRHDIELYSVASERVELEAQNKTETSYKWEVEAPYGATITISGGTTHTCNFEVNDRGGFRATLTVNEGLPDEHITSLFFSVPIEGSQQSIPALNETNEDNAESPFTGVRGSEIKQNRLTKMFDRHLWMPLQFEGSSRALTSDDNGYMFGASAGSVVLTLPAAAAGLRFRFIGTTANILTVERAGVDTIEGAHTTQYGSWTSFDVQLNGTAFLEAIPSGGGYVWLLTVIDGEVVNTLDSTETWVGGFNGVSGAPTPEGYIYVDEENGNDAWDGSRGRPYKTLAYAASTVAAPGDWATFNTPLTFVVYGTHSAAITMPYRRNISIIGGPAIISGKITWNYDSDYWYLFGENPQVDVGSLYIKPDVPQGFEIYDIEGKNAVDKTTCGWRRLGIKDSWINGNILNLESGNATDGRQTGELITLLENCEKNTLDNKAIGGQRETAMASEYANAIVLLTNWCEIGQYISGCVSFYRCVDTWFKEAIDWNDDPTSIGSPYAGAIGATQDGFHDCRLTGGASFGWDGATGSTPGTPRFDAYTFSNAVGATFTNLSPEYILTDTAAGVDVESSSFGGILTGKDNVQDALAAVDAADIYNSDAVIVVSSGGSFVNNGTKLKAAYTAATALTPGGQALATDNRAAVVVPYGKYDLGADTLDLDTEFVDIIGYGTCRNPAPGVEGVYTFPGSIIVGGDGAGGPVLNQTVRDIRLKSLLVVQDNDDDPVIVIDNANGADRSSYSDIGIDYSSGVATRGNAVEHGATNTTIAGVFTQCHADGPGFLAGGTFSGVVRECTALDNSFAGLVPGENAEFSGFAYDCRGKAYCFGCSDTGNAVFSGEARNVVVGKNGFGSTIGTGGAGTCSGKLYQCEATTDSYGYSDDETGTFSGEAWDSKGGDNCFGSTGDSANYGGSFSGAGRNLNAGNYSFGGSDGTLHDSFNGSAINCNGILGCFGTRCDFNGYALDCTAAGHSFGGTNGTVTQNAAIIRCAMNSMFSEIRAENLVIEGSFYAAHASYTDSAIEVVGDSVRLTRSWFNTDSSATYSIKSDGGSYDIKMTHCSMTKDIDPNLTNVIGAGNNVVDPDI